MPSPDEVLSILDSVSSGGAPAPSAPRDSYNDGRLRITVTPQQAQSPLDQKMQILDQGIAGKLETTPAPKRDIGAMESFGRGMASGLTANFYDELRGLHEAGGASQDEPFSIGTIIRGAAARMMGDKEAQSKYDETVARERETAKQSADQNPVADITGNVGGALLLPIGGMASAATLPGRMAVGAGLGAATGAAYGAGEGKSLPDRASRAASGAVLGGALGGAAPAVLSGVGKAAGAVSSGVGTVLGHPVQTLKAALNPENEAARRVGNALMTDMRSGRAGMSAADLRAAELAGQPAVIADIGGEGTRALARSAANTSPAARGALESVSSERFATQNDRVSDFIRNLVPTPANATRTQESLEAAARVANRPAYARAYAAGNRDIVTPEIQRLAESPDFASAVDRVMKQGRSRAVSEGVKFDPTKRNIQFWDYTYRELRDKADEAFRAGRGSEGSYLKQISDSLRKELDSAVPEYAAARAGAAAFFGAQNALEAGQKFVTMRGPIEQARAAFNKMSAPERAMFAEGFASDLADKVSKIANNRSVAIDRVFNSPDGKARIAMALGSAKAQELEVFLRRENIMDNLRRAMGGSSTARQQFERGLAGGFGSVGAGAAYGATEGLAESYSKGSLDLPAVARSMIIGSMLAGVVTGRQIINQKLAQRVGEMLASDDPKILANVARMAANNPAVGTAIRRAETAIEKISGERVGSAGSILPAIPAGRADQQQN